MYLYIPLSDQQYTLLSSLTRLFFPPSLPPALFFQVPPFATHLVGVAGFCLNKKNEVLLVKEGSKAVSGWKLPGGYVNVSK